MKKKRITKNVIKRFVACLMALALTIGSYVGDWGSLFVHKAYADDATQEVDITVKVSVSGISDDTNLSEQPTDWKLKKNDDNSEIEAKSVQRGQDTLDITFSIASGTQIVSDYKLLYNHVDSEGKTRESWNGTLTENSADDSITAVCNSIKTEYKRSVISVGIIKDGETSEELNDVSISFYKERSDAVEESVKLEKNKQYDIWLSDKDAQYTYSFSKDSDADLYNLTDTNELQDIVSIDNLIVNRKKIELNNDITIEPQDAETVIYKKDTTDKVNADELKSGIEYTLKISKINYESTTIDFTAGTSNMKMSQLTGVSDSKVTLSNKTYKVAGLGADSNATLTISKDGSNLTASNNEYTLNLGEDYSVTVKSNDATKFINSVEKKLEGSNVTVTLNGSMNNDGSWTGTLNAAEDAVDGYDGNAKVTLNTATGNATVEVEDVDSKPVTELYVNGKYSLKTNPEASTYKILQNGESKVNSKEINAFEIPVSLNPGEYTIEVYDASGNKMASKEITVAYKKIDIELYNINGNSTGDWYNSDVEIRSTKKDDFKYVWSDSDNISELPSLSDDIIKEIKADGTVEGYIYAYADRANDTSIYRSEKISIKVDKTAPEMNASVEETAEWSQSRIIKISDVSDVTSGMADSKVYISTEQKNTVEDIKKISTTETIADGKAEYIIDEEINGSRTYYLYVVDKAGNYTEKTVDIKNIDHTKPVLNASVKETADWSRQRTIEITASDALSGIEGSKVYISTEQKNTVEDIKKISTTAPIADGKAAYEITKELGNSQIYYLYVVDKAGNDTEKTVDIKNIDRTNPSITELKYYNESIYNDNPKGDKPAYTIEKRIESILSSNYNYFIFASKSVRIEFKVSDNLSGVETVQYSIDGNNYEPALNKGNGLYEIGLPSADIAEDIKKKLKYRIIDNAGNKLDVDNTKLIVETDAKYDDKDVHEATLNAVNTSNEILPISGSGYISENFTLQYNIKETFAGIKDVKVTKKDLNGSEEKRTLVEDSKVVVKDNDFAAFDKDDGYGTIYNDSESIELSKLYAADGKYVVTLDVTYNSGREEHITKTYDIDKVAPKVSDNIEVKSINDDEGNLENNVTYFKDDVKITFKATDVYMDKVEGAVYKYSSGKALDKYTDGDKEEGKLNVSSTDGNYTVTFTPTDNTGANELIYIVKATDKGGHSTIKESKVFVIDHTDPSIKDGNITKTDGQTVTAKNGVTYFNGDVKVSVDISDTNLNGESAVVKDSNDNKIADLILTKNGDSNIYTAEYAADGVADGTVMKVEVKATDKAGREDTLVFGAFVIDRTKPVVYEPEVTGTPEKDNVYDNVTYYRSNATIEFTASDTNLETVSGAVYKYIGKTDASDYVNEEPLQKYEYTVGNVETYKATAEFTPKDDKTGENQYIFIASADDKADWNTKSVSKVFVIDQTNPEVYGLEVSGTPANEYDDITYYSSDAEIKFTAKDTNLEKVSGAVYVYDINKGTDYTKYTDAEKAKGSLNLQNDSNGEYKAIFTPDDKTGANKYVFIASADDKALNNTKTVSKVFVIDQTDPSIKDGNIAKADGQTVTAKNGVTYFNGDVRVSVDISDANLNGESAVVKDSNDNKIADLTLTKNGDSSIYTAEYAADGVADGTVMKVEVKATDKAGRESTYVFGSFVIDRNAPVIENIKVEKTEATNVFEDKYYNGKVKVSFTYIDTNKESLSVKVKNEEKEEEVEPTSIHNNGNQYEFTYDKDIKAAEVVIEATDKAGNKSEEHKSSVFYIDRKGPVITAGGYKETGLSFSSSQLIKPLRSGMINVYARDNLTVSFKVTDDCSGIDRMEYTYVSTDKTETVYANAESEYTFEIPVSADYKNIIEVKVFDKSGNIWTTTTSNIRYVIESEAKHYQSYSGSITENNAANGNGFYNSDISLTLNATETFAGIKKIDYVIGSQISGTYEPDSDEEITEWTSNQLINAAANNNNDVHAEFTLTDNNNRTETVSKDYKIDVTAPVITVTYDNNSPANEKYYNATRTANISILERNMNNDSVTVTVTRDGSPVGVASAFTTNGEIVEADDGSDAYIYTMDYTFAEDGNYEFSVTATDLAGNVTNTAFSDEFTIDLTKPVINISVDGAAQGQTGFYSQAVTATITVTEHNFRAEDFVFNSSSDNNGTAVGSPAIGTFSNDGDVHTATVNYDYDALTTISASYSDMAANAADDVAPITFTVDLIDPEITVSNFVENKTYGKSETVSPEITITDTNFDASAVDIKFTGGKNGVINGSISSSDVANGRVYTISGVETDDVYTIDVSVKDKSGREKTYTSKFRVNRNGSSYALGNSAQTLNKTYVKAVGEDLIVTELNVDSLSSYIITYSRGGVIRQLEENKDYTVSVSMDSNGWQLYTYAINKNLFAEEGEYTINVSSVDEAGNNSDNTAKEQNLTFVVDDTAPTQVITGIKDGGVYSEDSIDVTVEVYDNVGIKELIVELNGKETKYTEEEINANGGKIVINIPSSDSRQSLKIRTVDYAGNETNVEEYSFTVSTNAWITFKARYATNPLFWVIVAAAVLVIGGGIAFVIVRKKRKDNE